MGVINPYSWSPLNIANLQATLWFFWMLLEVVGCSTNWREKPKSNWIYDQLLFFHLKMIANRSLLSVRGVSFQVCSRSHPFGFPLVMICSRAIVGLIALHLTCFIINAVRHFIAFLAISFVLTIISVSEF